ncbi:MAG: hypothetical protein HYZ48_01245 [Chlamydiales bacterium]|nr:hypothetical protein [Chlamydiales bacterium]
MLTAAVLPALGIGDALLMMIASHHLRLKGYSVTTFHNDLPELASWFPHQILSRIPPHLISYLQSFDLVIAENDNSLKIGQLLQAEKGKKIQNLSIFYPSYKSSKHAPLNEKDRVFDESISMVKNIQIAISSLLSISASTENGITPPSHLRYRSRLKRIALHPTSRVPSKNWSPHKFLKLAEKLKQQGFDPHFCLHADEQKDWSQALEIGCSLPHLPTLADLASFLFESGFLIGNDSLLGHLASCLRIPTLTTANDKKRMRLWRPDWHTGVLALPPQWLPNPRFARCKEDHWQHFLSVAKVLKAFEHLALKEEEREEKTRREEWKKERGMSYTI